MSVRVWLLNLDAEDELFRAGYKGPFEAVRARPDLPARIEGLVPEGDVVLTPGAAGAHGMAGRAWSPTPTALAALDRAGAIVPRAPDVSVLRRAASRELSFLLGATLPGALFTRDRREALARIGERCPSDRWLCRRSWGYAGRGRLVVPVGEPAENARGFIDRAVDEGGVLVEPWVDRLADLSLHGWLDPSGELVKGEVCLSEVTDGGSWVRSARAGAGASPAERSALGTALEGAAEALVSVGYFGPFGIDGFRYRWGEQVRFNPRCDLNARYTMAWATGMGDRRPDL